jgi:hypothetical protein
MTYRRQAHTQMRQSSAMKLLTSDSKDHSWDLSTSVRRRVLSSTGVVLPSVRFGARVGGAAGELAEGRHSLGPHPPMIFVW